MCKEHCKAIGPKAITWDHTRQSIKLYAKQPMRKIQAVVPSRSLSFSLSFFFFSLSLSISLSIGLWQISFEKCPMSYVGGVDYLAITLAIT